MPDTSFLIIVLRGARGESPMPKRRVLQEQWRYVQRDFSRAALQANKSDIKSRRMQEKIETYP